MRRLRCPYPAVWQSPPEPEMLGVCPGRDTEALGACGCQRELPCKIVEGTSARCESYPVLCSGIRSSAFPESSGKSRTVLQELE